MNKLNKIKIHFVGIGGIGMSGIAELMFDLGYMVQGSDISISANIKRLKKRGIKIYNSHHPNNIRNMSAIVFSTAIKKNNPELLESKRLYIPLISRADMLAELMKLKKSIAIAGSHGKTTTTSLVGSIFDNANYDPTIVNGGIINSYSKNNRYGRSNWMIVEADESDGSFLKLPHEINIITNIDIEHLDYYKSKQNLLLAFEKFVTNLPFYGYSIICTENINSREVYRKINTRRMISYSKSQNSDVKIIKITKDKKGNNFSLYFKKGVIKGIKGKYYFKTNLMGDHNIFNSTAAIIAALLAEIPIKKIKNSLKDFQGVKRRFSFIGKINKASIYDDYAHHPSEIKASYDIAKQISDKKIVIVFQPHRYTRTKILQNEFVKILTKVDILYILDIYSAGEKSIPNINSKNLVKKIKIKNKNTFYIKNPNNLRFLLTKYFNDKNIIVFMGAGSITNLANELIS
ncbi:UDP-N-acetylmuramate--L-alanine ligase [Alphaproteobacteria bacterium]|nr:UDP-N-acetylmuramate--L-alanine ligase [Alphaproteobacteria bacterium]